MHLTSRGILEIDICVSISYRPRSGTVKAFLQGCSSEQQTKIGVQLQEFAHLAQHPLLVPILLVELKVCCLEDREAELWNLLVDVETRSKQTGAPAINVPFNGFTEEDWEEDSKTRQERLDSEIHHVTLDVVGVIQQTTYSESHAKALLLSIEEIRKNIKIVNDMAVPQRMDQISTIGAMFSERLDFLGHRTRVVIGDIEFVEKRAQAQQSAVCPQTNFDLKAMTFRSLTAPGL